MPTMINDAALAERLIAERRTSGADRYDEVWEGTYMMAPMPNDEHQEIVGQLFFVLQEAVGWSGAGEVRPGVNVSDREHDWIENYRVPDVALFLKAGRAKNCGTHWWGGPDLAVEVTSQGDRTRDKLPFYSQVRVQELIILDRDPWQLERYRLVDAEPVQRSVPGSTETIRCDVLPLELRLVPAEPRPRIELSDPTTGRVRSL